METVHTSPGQQEKITGGLRLRGFKKKGEGDRPLVSVITIVYNGVEHIRQTIDSVLAQTYAPVEYIIIDGGSRDGTVSILGEYEERVDFWQSETDAGVSDAFNKGIRLAGGEFIGLINCGDWYETDTVQQVVGAFMANQEVGIVCGALQFWKAGERQYLCHCAPHLLEREMTVTHPTCFVRTELYHRFGLFSTDYTLAMDYELLLRLKRRGTRFLAMNFVLANMQHDGVSEAHWKEALLETHKARTALLENSFYASRCYYWFLVVKRGLRICFEKLGWDGLLRLYRGKLALVKKSKP